MRTDLLIRPRAMLPAGAAAGALTGAVAWLLFATSSGDLRRLSEDQDQLRAVHFEGRDVPAIDPLVAEAVTHPLFALTTGPGAQVEPAVLVTGVARTSYRRAALVSVNGAPAAWLAVGESSGSVSIVDVAPPKVVVETPFGRKDVYLGEGAAGSAGTSGAASPASRPDTLPTGARIPPAPADAPTPP